MTKWMKVDNLICGIGCIIFVLMMLLIYAGINKNDLSGFTPYGISLLSAAGSILITTYLGLLDVSIVVFILVFLSFDI